MPGRRRPVLPVRPAPVVGADGRHLPHSRHGVADRHRAGDRPGRRAGAAHPDSHPQARARDTAVGAAAAAMVDDPARHRRSADRGDGGRGDLGQPGHRGAVALRCLRRGRRAGHPGDAGVLSGVRRRAAAEAGQGEEAAQEARQEDRRGLGRGDDQQPTRLQPRRLRRRPSRTRPRPPRNRRTTRRSRPRCPRKSPAEAEPEAEPDAGALRNKRPSGKTSHRLRRRNRGGVALDD